MLTVRIQVIDGTGTFTLSDSQPCRLLTSLHLHYPASAVLRTSPPPQGARPVPHGLPVGRRRPRFGASRVACAFLVYMLPPLPRRSVDHRGGGPEYGHRSRAGGNAEA